MNQSNTNFASIANQSQDDMQPILQRIDANLESLMHGEEDESAFQSWSKPSVAMSNFKLVATLMGIVESQQRNIRRLESQISDLWDNIDTLNTIVLDPLDGVPDSPAQECEEASAPSDNSLSPTH